VALASAAFATLGPGASAVDGPSVVVGGPEDQHHPWADAAHLIWTQASSTRPEVDHAYGKVRGEDGRFRLDAKGTRGAAGGIDPGGERAIYQQMTDRDSDLFWYAFGSGSRSRVRAPGVNTDRWERDPRVSAAFVLFARDAGSSTRLLLLDRATKTVERIASYDLTRFYVAPGSVGERYATWSTCGPFTCLAWWYDTQAADPAPRKLPSVDGRPQYALTIDEAGGLAYVVRSGSACGSSVGIWRRPWPFDPGTSAERVVALPSGIDVGWTLAVDRSHDPRVDLWFSRFRCGRQQGDVAVLRDVETLP
jgi:hypothetical protein